MGSTVFRDIPDSPCRRHIYVVADDGQALDIGGTSAAHFVGAFCSLVNQKAVLTGSR